MEPSRVDSVLDISILSVVRTMLDFNLRRSFHLDRIGSSDFGAVLSLGYILNVCQFLELPLRFPARNISWMKKMVSWEVIFQRRRGMSFLFSITEF
jgi:hypothetical protein